MRQINRQINGQIDRKSNRKINGKINSQIRYGRLLPTFLAAAMTVAALTGCGNEKQPADSEAITLLDPVTASANTEKAAYRSLYDYQTYSGTVYPGMTEYSFAQDVSFYGYEQFPGEEVTRGEIIATADNKSIQNEIESLEETIEQLDETYADQMEELDRHIATAQEELQDTRDWAAIAIGDADRLGRQIAEQEIEVNGMLRDRAEKTDLYELDSAYYHMRLNALREEQQEEQIEAGAGGVVVSIGDYTEGDGIQAKSPVVAVADTSQKLVKCEYFAQSKIEDMKRIYAMIDGVQYNVTYIPYAPGEYGNLLARGETAYSYFAIEDPDNVVEFGSLVAVVMIKDEVADCLSVPKSAIHSDEGGDYVYSVVDGTNEKKYIETGFSDGVYTQVLSGITDEDYILLTDYKTLGEATYTLEKSSFVNLYTANGYLDYPDYTLVSCELEYGSVSFVEYAVEQYSVVERGDVVARISVEADEILLEEKNMRLARQQERLQDLIDSLSDPKENLTAEGRINRQKQIEEKQEQITEMTEEIQEMEACYQTTEIRANTDGIVIWRADKQSGSTIQYEEGLMLIATQDTCYLEIENSGQTLSYGNVLQVEFTDSNGTKTTVDGMVVTVSQAALSGGMTSEYAYLQLPVEAIAQMAPTENANTSRWSRKAYNVSGTPRKMDNVLLVPKNAVTTTGGQTYVYVIDENGEKSARSFIAGGFDAQNYWVLEGLEEGMTLCLE